MEIIPLRENTQMATHIAEHIFTQWGHKKVNCTLDTVLQSIGDIMLNNKPPIILVAIDNGKYLGSATLKIREMTIYPEKEFWIGDVIVTPEMRGKGIGSKLVKAIEHLAKSFAIGTLYLFTDDKEQMYFKLGWIKKEIVFYNGRNVTVMSKNL